MVIIICLMKEFAFALFYDDIFIIILQLKYIILRKQYLIPDVSKQYSIFFALRNYFFKLYIIIIPILR